MIGVELEEEGAGIEGEVEGTEVVVEVVEAEAEGVDGGGEGAQLGHRSHHRRILSVQHYMGIQFPSGCNRNPNKSLELGGSLREFGASF